MFHVKQRIAANSFRPNQKYYTHENCEIPKKTSKKWQLKSECIFVYGVGEAGDKKDKEQERG